MELTINIEDKKMYDSFVQFLNVLGITVSESRQSGTENKRSSRKQKYPLSGTVLKYDDPFGPAADISDWEAAK
ncbi:MAG: hypothetical protein COS14_02490 [Bacteroidetes bacterium CG02_land_8_20_14_3_00_31_25]|nr:MAG: hypothetical protein COS14_02490 [Bacteroidetes bacterium CG02_land_8_20_14_3_00_31_25]PIX33222.1 MAG: hypothetical protein COZ59_09805 [Bacteroidetes bacterium CG_4_8_14_3_um_filter_31_14]PIY02149.1 MAG: hypothetical protein COZ21_15665 [Bacteroidetes bacterium CG_4_10_14_3_um_filter_31_20]